MVTTARRPRGPYRKGLERRAQIMRAALEVFAEHGDRGSSLREIADRVGMSQAGVLHYFGSREELLTAVLAERDTADAAEHTSTAVSPGDAMARTAEHNTRSPGLVSLFVNLSADATDPEHPAHGFFVERYARLRETVADWLRQGQADGSVRTDVPAEQLAQLLISVSDGLQQQWLLDEGIDMVAAIDAFNRLCRPPGA